MSWGVGVSRGHQTSAGYMKGHNIIMSFMI